jgi:hypothetical protein
MRLGRPPLVPIELRNEERDFLNRDKSYKASAPATEQRISQAAFAALDPLTVHLDPRPGNLAELLQALADSPSDNFQLAAALLEQLEGRGYFELLQAPGPDELEAATPALAKSWLASAQRHRAEGLSHLQLACRSPYPLWKRFAQMHVHNALLFEGLAAAS